ncbi:hypothetical protein [uncultured Lactobacillus sp.]|uniref:hypothetical protein n=1 Tax=uncultured Lactobacillus sp. TaxID=153152 RepID=UPI00261A64DF|nr:hypothetical protein [uncultured Lactobacillus sp.]
MVGVWFLYLLVPLTYVVITGLTTKKWKIGIYSLILPALLAGINTYFLLPSKNLLSIVGGNLFYLLIFILIYLFFAFVLTTDNSDDEYTEEYKSKKRTLFWLIAGNVLLLIVWGTGAIHSGMSVKPTYQSINKEYSKSTRAPTFKRGETPIALAPVTVLNRVRKSASDIPHSQYYSVSKNVQAQYYKGKPVYVVPVEYNGFFEMRNAKEIPGYFIIDATKQSATPKFVKVPYKYATSAYFGKDASRQIYRKTSDWLTLGDPQLEINDVGKPYWVQTIYKSEAFSHRINFKKLHVAVLNAQNGDVKVYSLKSMPKFIDEGITDATASKINKVFGKYKHGFWNAHFGKSDVIKPTGNGVENGVTSVFNKDGSISYFTDFTTDKTGSDSAMGYSMINARTGKLTYYKASNLMDSDGAKHNANQDYKAQQWKANMPILYNVNGSPTWVMTILDSTNAIRGYYYLNASDQSIYAQGSTPTSALDAYRQALVNNGGSVGNTSNAVMKNITGQVDRVAIISNQNKAMFTLQGSNIIYSVNTNDYIQANLLQKGDKVSFKASMVKGQPIGNVKKFKDENLTGR